MTFLSNKHEQRPCKTKREFDIKEGTSSSSQRVTQDVLCEEFDTQYIHRLNVHTE